MQSNKRQAVQQMNSRIMRQLDNRVSTLMLISHACCSASLKVCVCQAQLELHHFYRFGLVEWHMLLSRASKYAWLKHANGLHHPQLAVVVKFRLYAYVVISHVTARPLGWRRLLVFVFTKRKFGQACAKSQHS